MKKYIIKYIKNGRLKKIIIAIAISLEATSGTFAQFLTANRDFSSQFIFQTDLQLKN